MLSAAELACGLALPAACFLNVELGCLWNSRGPEGLHQQEAHCRNLVRWFECQFLVSKFPISTCRHFG